VKLKFQIAIVALVILALFGASFLFVEAHDIIVLNPKGMIAEHQRDIFYSSLGLMMIVVIPVFFMALFFAWKYRESNEKSEYKPEFSHSKTAEVFWWGVPFVIIVFLAIMTWTTSHSLNPFKPIASKEKPIEIQAVALEWKWLFLYPEQGIATVNFVQFPVGKPVSFEITAEAPMNSFWIPQLGGQIYAMPSMRSRLHLMAGEAGDYWGRSANFSGKGFAGMTFTAKASSQEEFDSWVSKVKGSKKELSWNMYKELVKPSSYDPPEYFSSMTDNLFERILMQYEPEKKKE